MVTFWLPHVGFWKSRWNEFCTPSHRRNRSYLFVAPPRRELFLLSARSLQRSYTPDHYLGRCVEALPYRSLKWRKIGVGRLCLGLKAVSESTFVVSTGTDLLPADTGLFTAGADAEFLRRRRAVRIFGAGGGRGFIIITTPDGECSVYGVGGRYFCGCSGC